MAHMTKEIPDCIGACDPCRGTCLATLKHCLEMGGEHARAGHVRLLLDCAEARHSSANIMARGSDLRGDVCGVCADACELYAGLNGTAQDRPKHAELVAASPQWFAESSPMPRGALGPRRSTYVRDERSKRSHVESTSARARLAC